MIRRLRNLTWLSVGLSLVWGTRLVLAELGTERTYLPLVLQAVEGPRPDPTLPAPTQTILPSATTAPTATPAATSQACPYPNGSPMADLYCTGGLINTPLP